jgi:hypothetical protein
VSTYHTPLPKTKPNKKRQIKPNSNNQKKHKYCHMLINLLKGTPVFVKLKSPLIFGPFERVKDLKE